MNQNLVTNLLQLFKNIDIIAECGVVLLNLSYQPVLSYPPYQGNNCLFRQENLDICACEREMRAAMEHHSRPEIYTCAGEQLKALLPIYSGGDVEGYLRLGRCGDFDLSRQASLRPMQALTRKRLQALAEILQSCIRTMDLSPLLLPAHRTDFLRVSEYIDGNLSEDLSAATICASLYISRNGLYRLVREETGQSLGQYVASRRMKQAKKLLLSTDYSILRISELCGISDFNYFSRLFKKHYGTSPRQYRQAPSN